MKRNRLPTHVRMSEMLDAALKLATQHGYSNITLQQVADAVKCTHGLVSHHFGNAPKMRRAILREAIRTRTMRVILQGLAARDPIALKVPEELRREALNLVM